MKTTSLILILFSLSPLAQAYSISGGAAVMLAYHLNQVAPTSTEATEMLTRILANQCDDSTNDVTMTDLAFHYESVRCNKSHVVTAHYHCYIQHLPGDVRVETTGSEAQSLFATLLENGVEPDGHAGGESASVMNISIHLNPSVIFECGGGGATGSMENYVAQDSTGE